MHFRQTYNKAPSRLCAIDIETIAPSAPDGGFPPWPLHRPIVASMLTADQAEYGQWHFAIESVEFDDERAALARIDELLGGRRCLTYNGKGFDCSVLVNTAIRASMYECSNLTDAWASHRYNGSHVDLADLVTNFGSAPRVSLEMLCEAVGIPVKKNGHGDNIAEMLDNNGIESVRHYCEEDVSSTLICHAMFQAMRGNEPTYAASLICDFANWVVDDGLEHLYEFRKLSGNPVLERIRLHHRVEEGLRAFGDRATSRHFDQEASGASNSRTNSAG